MLTVHEQSVSTCPPPTIALDQLPLPTTSPAILLREAYARSSTTPSYAVPRPVTRPLVATSSQVSQLPKVPGAAASIAIGGSAVPANKLSVSSLCESGARRGALSNSVLPLRAVSAHWRDSSKEPREAPILGHALTDNKSAANHLRLLLNDEVQSKDPRRPQHASPDTAGTQDSGPATSQCANDILHHPEAETSERVSVGCAGPNRASSTLLAEAYRQEYGAPYVQSGGMLGGPNTSLTAHQAPPQSPNNLHLPTRSERALSAYPFQPASPSPHQSSYRLFTRSATPSTLASTLCSIAAVQRKPNHQRTGSFPAHTDSLASALASGLVKLKRPRSSPAPPQPLLLPGLGGGRSRNEYGRSLTGGQDTGVGVIGGVQVPNHRGYREGSVLSSLQELRTPHTLRSRSQSLDQAGVVGRVSLSTPFLTDNPQGASASRETALVNGGACDIPMLTTSVLSQPPGPDIEELEQGKIRAGPHLVDLDPDLPPLAVEHPARVWNSMLHSLSAGLQPVVKWDYERVYPGEGVEAQTIARLTLILPPTHPAIAQHPLFRALNKNKYTKEYIASVEALGGVREWTGEPKKLKGDAQNSTLIKCIAEDALAWVHVPLLSTLPQGLDEDEIEDEYPVVPQTGPETPVSTSIGAGHDFYPEKLTGHQQENMSNHGQYQARRPDLTSQMDEEEERRKLRAKSTSVSIPAWAERLLQPQEGNHGRYAPAPTPTILESEQDGNAEEARAKTSNEDEIQLDDADEVIENRHHGDVLPGASDGVIHGHDDQPMAIQPLSFQRLTDIILMTFGSRDVHLASLVTLQESRDASSRRFGATLTVGHGDLVQTYQEDCVHLSADEAKEAVCQRALALNVEGFLEWLTASMAGGGGVVSAGQQGAASAHSADEASMVSVEANQDEMMPGAKADSNGVEVDWQAQLAHFCSISGLERPGYSQKVERVYGEVAFLGTILLEEEQFASSVPRRTIVEARQDVARLVYVEHFGQEVVLALPGVARGDQFKEHGRGFGVSVKTKRGAGDGDEVEEELRGGVVCFLVRSEMCDD